MVFQFLWRPERKRVSNRFLVGKFPIMSEYREGKEVRARVRQFSIPEGRTLPERLIKGRRPYRPDKRELAFD